MQNLDTFSEIDAFIEISNAIAAAQNKGELIEVLLNNFRELVPFDDILLTVFSKQKNTHREWAYHYDKRRMDYPGFDDFINSDHPVSDGILNILMNQKDPEIFDIDKLLARHDVPAYVYAYKSTGIMQLAGVIMRNGNIEIGGMFLTSESRGRLNSDHLSVIKGLSSQVCMAIANILSIEEITRHENEKSVLLNLSSVITAIRTKDQLLKVLNDQVRQLIGFEYVVMTLRNGDNETSAIYVHSFERFTSDDHFSCAVRAEAFSDFDMKFKLVKYPVVFNASSLYEEVSNHSIQSKIKMDEIAGISMFNGDEMLGGIYFLASQKGRFITANYNLIRSIGDQLTLALLNVLANERIERQIDEISSYKQQLEEENIYLQEEISSTNNYTDIVGSDASIQKIYKLISQVSGSHSTVLILGETGTGKELIARAIHNNSPRKDKVMIKVNCATLPANLIESELFGHEKGAFTGATDKRIGKFELANHSTLFLDEIGELPLDLQVKLLRALQEKEIERVGGRSTIRVDVRIIAATNRNLLKEVHLGNFRSDLYFRLNVFPITLPPLRDRKNDIPMLACHFLTKHSKNIKGIMKLTSKAVKQLSAYNWPGNIRELEHVIERSILLSSGPTIDRVYVHADEETYNETDETYIKSIDEVEREHIIAVLIKCNNKVSGIGGAAEMLRIPSTTLNSKMRRLNIKKQIG